MLERVEKTHNDTASMPAITESRAQLAIGFKALWYDDLRRVTETFT